MKKSLMVIIGICCLGLLAPNLASAKGKKNKPTPEQITAAKAIMAKYDTNTNGVLDPEEVTALNKDYAAGNEPDAKLFDLNGDNTLDDTEIATIQKDATTKSKKKKSADQ